MCISLLCEYTLYLSTCNLVFILNLNVRLAVRVHCEFIQLLVDIRPHEIQTSVIPKRPPFRVDGNLFDYIHHPVTSCEADTQELA